jgi:hypothetical protein
LVRPILDAARAKRRGSVAEVAYKNGSRRAAGEEYSFSSPKISALTRLPLFRVSRIFEYHLGGNPYSLVRDRARPPNATGTKLTGVMERGAYNSIRPRRLTSAAVSVRLMTFILAILRRHVTFHFPPQRRCNRFSRRSRSKSGATRARDTARLSATSATTVGLKSPAQRVCKC